MSSLQPRWFDNTVSQHSIALVRDTVVSQISNGLPAFLDYRTHIAANSIYNTPPVVAIYTMLLVLRWMVSQYDSLDQIDSMAYKKSGVIYDALEAREDLYTLIAPRADRSRINITFDLKDRDPKRVERFLNAAKAHGFNGLEGHRSQGGFRASLYNPLPLTACHDLAQFLLGYQP